MDREYQKKLEKADRDRHRVFGDLKGWSNDRFWKWMNWLHSQAYEKCQKHYTEALESTQGITKAKVKEVHERVYKIRNEWDGMRDITIEESELWVQGINKVQLQAELEAQYREARKNYLSAKIREDEAMFAGKRLAIHHLYQQFIGKDAFEKFKESLEQEES